MIYIDSIPFQTDGTAQVAKLTRNKTFNDSIGGYLITTRSRFVRWRMSYTLSVNRTELETLQELFAEHLGRLDFIDHRGFSWIVGTGTDDATHAYGTGAEPEDETISAPPDTPKNYQACDASFHVQLNMIVSARGLASADVDE